MVWYLKLGLSSKGCFMIFAHELLDFLYGLLFWLIEINELSCIMIILSTCFLFQRFARIGLVFFIIPFFNIFSLSADKSSFFFEISLVLIRIF